MTDESMEALHPSRRNPSMCGELRGFVIPVQRDVFHCTDDEGCECEVCVSFQRGNEDAR